MNHRIPLALIAIILICLSLAGQTPTPPANAPATAPATPPAPKSSIEGTVTRAGGGQPLKGVQVTVQRTDTTAAAGRGGRGGNAAGLGALNNGGAGLGALGDLLNTVISAVRGATSVTTDASGHFAITGLDAGQYQISADREGMIHQEYGRRSGGGRGTSVAIAAGQTFSANIQMDPAGVIAGRVRDNAGEPIFRATVQAYTYRYANGNRTLAQVATIQTDDLGQYRLFPILPGDYFVSVVSQPETTGPSQADASSGARGAQALANLVGQSGNLQDALAQALGGQQAGGPAPLYYPGSIDPDAATPIHVAASAEVRGIDLNLRPVPTVVVSGRVAAPFSLAPPPAATGAAGRGGTNAGQAAAVLGALGAAGGQGAAQVTFNRIGGTRAGLGALIGGLNPIRVDATGAFEIKNVAPGSYYLSATASDNGQRYTGRTRVDVSSANITNVTVDVRPSIEVHGRITVDSPPQNFKMSQLRVNLVEADNPLGNIGSLIGDLLQGGRANGARGASGGQQGARGGQTGQAGQAGRGGATATAAMPQVADDGTFTIKNANTSVEYRVTISNASGGYLLDGRVGSSDALGSTFTVDAGSQLSLRIGFAAGKVSGTVADAGKPFPGAQVVLIPDPPRRSRNDMYFSATSDANGAFNFNSVPAGSYRMFAWEDVPSGAYQYPEFLRPYEQLGVPVRVEQGGSASGDLKLIPAND